MLGDDKTDGEFDYQNELLQTIYFPKKVKNIGYLTDKLPKAKYEDLIQRDKKMMASDTLKDGNLPSLKKNIDHVTSNANSFDRR